MTWRCEVYPYTYIHIWVPKLYWPHLKSWQNSSPTRQVYLRCWDPRYVEQILCCRTQIPAISDSKISSMASWKGWSMEESVWENLRFKRGGGSCSCCTLLLTCTHVDIYTVHMFIYREKHKSYNYTCILFIIHNTLVLNLLMEEIWISSWCKSYPEHSSLAICICHLYVFIYSSLFMAIMAA